MSTVTILCGPSGSGKSSLQQAIITDRAAAVDLVQRTTTRAPRTGELENPEYEFVSRDSFVASLASNEFVDHTDHHGILYGIRRAVLESHLSSSSPSILVSGTNSAIRLKKTYPSQIRVVFVYAGDVEDLRRWGLDPESPPNRELSRRLSERALTDSHNIINLEHWLDVRMTRNLSRAASLLNELTQGFEATVIHNARGQLDAAVDDLRRVLAKNVITDRGSSQTAYSNAHLPRKRVGATALYVNNAGEVLIVKPTYRSDWLTPGGTVDEKETPFDGCCREVREELGRPFPVHRLLCIEYRSAHGTKVENLQFVFWGGELDRVQVEQIRLPDGEIEAFQFCDVNMLGQFLNPTLANRVVTAMKARLESRVIYLENTTEIT